MNRISILCITLVLFLSAISISFKPAEKDSYKQFYGTQMKAFTDGEQELMNAISAENIQTQNGKQAIKNKIATARLQLKAIDFWLRYLNPLAYHKINGSLPIEWETEVFEKYEQPYKREGAGLTLAELYVGKKDASKDSLLCLIKSTVQTMDLYGADSITVNLKKHDHFFLANRLFLLNIATIYTTGFECPNPDNIIPELLYMLQSTRDIYSHYNEAFPNYTLSAGYLDLYNRAILFVKQSRREHNTFDQFSFLKNYVNPLFALNQKMIRNFGMVSINFNDFSLSDTAGSIFSKSLYQAQNAKGVYLAVEDQKTLAEIKKIGKLLFYDPILSGNNKRSCASCHQSTEYFTDTAVRTALQFDGRQKLDRNTPSLINAVFNHLLMLDGKHSSLISQGKAVITNPLEMGGDEKEVLKKVLSCKEYNNAFKRFVKLTPNLDKISLDHIVSAIILYYSSFSNFYSPFDNAMNKNEPLREAEKTGFNIFMSKAKCGTCHFAPQFNGVKPPYINTEFEVLGTPQDASYTQLSPDAGRSAINPVNEAVNAFRTGSIRNAMFTKPYMHNGVFNTLEQVVDFYDAGGGVGKGINVNNQTLASDSLKLSSTEKYQLVAFINSLNENILFEATPGVLPVSSNVILNKRIPGGEY